MLYNVSLNFGGVGKYSFQQQGTEDENYTEYSCVSVV